MNRRAISWAIAALALVAVSSTAAFRADGDSTAYRLGAFVGALLLALVVAVVIRAIAVRVRESGGRTWSPAVLALATGIATLLAVGAAARDVAKPAACATPERSADALLGEVPDGLRTAPATAEIRRELVKSFRELGPKRVSSLMLLRGDVFEAALVSIEVDERVRLDELIDGVETAANATGTDVPFGESDGRMLTTKDVTIAYGVAGTCAMGAVYAASPKLARAIAENLRVEK